MIRKFLFLFLMVNSSMSWAVLDIEISGGVVGEHPIAIVPFSWEPKEKKPALEVSKVLTANLKRTGRFDVIPDKNFREFPHHGGEVNFENWRAVGVESLVVGRIRPGTKGGYQIQFQLFDIYKKSEVQDAGPGVEEYQIKQVIGYSLPTTAANLRSTAHYMSDLIYEALTGEKGIFTTRVAYVIATGSKGAKQYALQIADMDGYNPDTILNSSQPIMSPSWSPDANKLAYVSFEKKKAQIYVQDVATGKRRLVSAARGVNGAPSWSPDGTKLALTLSRDGNLEIYTLDLKSLRVKRLTRNSSIDTEPVWSPDGKSIAFVSDRSGRPQVYRMPAQGGRAQRLSFQGNYNARPVFQPGGKMLAIVHGNADGYHIATLDIDSGIIDILTQGRLDESPSFAPNGSMILFAASENNRAILSAVSVDGKKAGRLKFKQGDVRDPAWAPYRK